MSVWPFFGDLHPENAQDDGLNTMVNHLVNDIYSFILSLTMFFKKNTMSFENFPYAFKKRITNLAPVPYIDTFCKICPEFNQLCNNRPERIDQVFITDLAVVKYLATKNRIPFFRRYKFLYKHLRFFIDYINYFSVSYHYALSLNEVIAKQRQIYVEDTLFLHCESVESYDKLLPYICGPYTRLVLCGRITWPQIRRLIHAKVLRVYIYATIEIKPEEYDDFAALVVQQTRSLHSSFHVQYNIVPEFRATIAKAFKNHATHSYWLFEEGFDTWVVIHKNYHWYYLMCWLAAMGLQIGITELIGLIMGSWYWLLPGALFTSVVNVQTIRVCLIQRNVLLPYIE
uniref:Anoctamin n=1 Tax=Panagrellus redivivus TaxID=6233 RepID=A0A7E4ZRT5_PANRE